MFIFNRRCRVSDWFSTAKFGSSSLWEMVPHVCMFDSCLSKSWYWPHKWNKINSDWLHNICNSVSNTNWELQALMCNRLLQREKWKICSGSFKSMNVSFILFFILEWRLDGFRFIISLKGVSQCSCQSGKDTEMTGSTAENIANYAEEIIIRYPNTIVGIITDDTTSCRIFWMSVSLISFLWVRSACMASLCQRFIYCPDYFSQWTITISSSFCW